MLRDVVFGLMPLLIDLLHEPMFNYEGHLYTKDKASKQDPSLTFWRCIKKDECKGRLVTRDGVFDAIKCGHTHDPSAAETDYSGRHRY